MPFAVRTFEIAHRIVNYFQKLVVALCNTFSALCKHYMGTGIITLCVCVSVLCFKLLLGKGLCNTYAYHIFSSINVPILINASPDLFVMSNCHKNFSHLMQRKNTAASSK